MEPELIEKILTASPWLAPIMLGLFLVRKEIAAILTASGTTTVSEMVARLDALLHLQTQHGEDMTSSLKDLLEVQRQIHVEIVRQSQRVEIVQRGGR